jgi:hypothetical protein
MLGSMLYTEILPDNGKKPIQKQEVSSIYHQQYLPAVQIDTGEIS